jgi:hypothetical protein
MALAIQVYFFSNKVGFSINYFTVRPSTGFLTSTTTRDNSMMGLRIQTTRQRVLIYGSFSHSYLNKFITTLFIYNHYYKLTLQDY